MEALRNATNDGMPFMTWRLPAGVLLTLLVGVVAGLLFQRIAGPLIVGSAVLGVGPGLIWESEAVHAANRARFGVSPQDPPISWPVALLSYAFLGMILGGWLMALTSVLIGGVVLPLIPLVLRPGLGNAFKRRFGMRDLLLAAGGMVAGDLLVLALIKASS